MKRYSSPKKRADRQLINNQVKEISQSPVMDALLEVSGGLLAVLNEDRQVVALNYAFLEMLGLPDIENLLGLRLGEILGCVHALNAPEGCGTTAHCETCGAAIATLLAIEENIEKEQICALVANRDGHFSDICLQVRAKPIMVDKKRWILFYAQDISKEQFWVNLDRIFFHDINNTLTALYGNAQILEMTAKDNSTISEICKSIDRLVTEISIQKELSHYRDATFKSKRVPISLRQIKTEIDRTIIRHKSSIRKKIKASWPEKNIMLHTDYTLLSRVLQNMIINALEATNFDDIIQITVAHDKTKGSVKWEVWNRSCIPEPIQKRIFQRNFSSKPGKGRGLGTYSMKLFGETYLGGQVSFTSSPEQGTTFVFILPVNMEE